MLPALSDNPREEPRRVPIAFLEGLRVLAEDELAQYDITRYQVTKFYRDQIQKSGSYEQRKYIVEPSLQEFRAREVLIPVESMIIRSFPASSTNILRQVYSW